MGEMRMAQRELFPEGARWQMTGLPLGNLNEVNNLPASKPFSRVGKLQSTAEGVTFGSHANLCVCCCRRVHSHAEEGRGHRTLPLNYLRQATTKLHQQAWQILEMSSCSPAL